MAKKENVKHCRFNANRKASKYAWPYCTWVRDQLIKMPYGCYISQKDVLTDSDCNKCECFEKAVDE